MTCAVNAPSTISLNGGHLSRVRRAAPPARISSLGLSGSAAGIRHEQRAAGTSIGRVPEDRRLEDPLEQERLVVVEHFGDDNVLADVDWQEGRHGCGSALGADRAGARRIGAAAIALP